MIRSLLESCSDDPKTRAMINGSSKRVAMEFVIKRLSELDEKWKTFTWKYQHYGNRAYKTLDN